MQYALPIIDKELRDLIALSLLVTDLMQLTIVK